jgi:broad specificity phosphatase PhoE
VTSSATSEDTTTVLFVRHAEVHNPGAVLYGRLARFDLSPAGQAHAERIADFLADWPVTRVVSSPLLRARRVAAVIAGRHPDASVGRSALLNEVGSAWQGTPFREFPAGFNTYDNQRHADDESMEQIRDRMLAFIRQAARRDPGATVVAVSHGDPITILRVTLMKKPLTVAALRGGDYAALGSITRVQVGPDGRPVSMDILAQVR